MLKFSEVKKIKIFKGFTLGEMLFVMIIISILVALTTPAITKRTRTSFRTVTADIWKYINNTDIYFVNRVNIGANPSSTTFNPRLYIYGAPDIYHPQIGLHVKDNAISSDGFLLNMAYSRLILGSGTTTATANYGIAIGYNATVNTTHSIAIGSSTSVSNTGNPGVAIGNQALASGSNSIAIGYKAKASNANQIVLGGSGNTLHIGSQVISSDLGLKNIKGAYKRGIKDLRNLNAYLFTFKDDEDSTVRAGLIAQDVKHTIPEAVDVIDSNGHLGIKNEFVNFAMFNAISDVDKYLRATVKKQFILKHKVAQQEAELRQLEKELEELSKS